MANNDTRTAEGKEMETARTAFENKWLSSGHYGIDIRTALYDGFEAGWNAANDEHDRYKALLKEAVIFASPHANRDGTARWLIAKIDEALTEAAAGGGEKDNAIK